MGKNLIKNKCIDCEKEIMKTNYHRGFWIEVFGGKQ